MTACSTASAFAQSNRQLARRVDEAVALRDQAGRELVAYRMATAPASMYTDTLSFAGGAMRVLTTRALRPRVQAAVALADSMLAPRATAIVGRFRDYVFTVRPSDDTTRKSALVARRMGAYDFWTSTTDLDPTSLGRMFLSQAMAVALEQASPPLRQWLTELPADTVRDAEWARVRLELVTSPATVSRSCYAGDLAGCKAVLGLTKESDPLTTWYDAAGRRALVRAFANTRGIDPNARDLCIAGNDSECMAILRVQNIGLTAPGSALARGTLVGTALALGGPAALDRLLSSKDSVPGAVAAAAGVPLDSVLVVWRSKAHDRGIVSASFSPAIGLVALAWILVMGGLAFRSPRWR